MAVHWREDTYGAAERRELLSAWRRRFFRQYFVFLLPSWLLVQAVWVVWRGWPRDSLGDLMLNLCAYVPGFLVLAWVQSRWARQHPDEAAALKRSRAQL
jgi:uncharacterized membrane protein YqaE (UPF0057 family)